MVHKKGTKQAVEKLEANIVGCALFCKYTNNDGDECSYLASATDRNYAGECIKEQGIQARQDWTLKDMESSESINNSRSFEYSHPLVELDSQIEIAFPAEETILKNIANSIKKIISR